MSLLIKESSLKTFLDAVKMHGESTITELLKQLKKDNSVIKHYIISLVTNNFNVSWELITNPNTNHFDCRCVVSYMFKVYLSMKHHEIASELNIQKIQTIQSYFSKIKNLNTKIPHERELKIKIEYIENELINFINHGKTSKNNGHCK